MHVPLLSGVQLFATPWTAAHQAPLSFAIPWCLLKLMPIESVMISKHLILCHSLLLLPSIFLSIRVFSKELTVHIRWLNYWSFNISPSNEYLGPIESVMISKHLILCHSLLLLPSIFLSIRVFSKEWTVHIRWLKYWSVSISPSNEYLGLTSFRIDWFAVQGTLKSLLQHHSLKASILWCSAIFMAHVSHPYMTTGKTVTLTAWIFVGKVMSLLFNTLSRFIVISVHGVTQTRILEWVAIFSSRESTPSSD